MTFQTKSGHKLPGSQFGLIVLLESQDERNQAALGYDMFGNDATRRAALQQAMATGKVSASAPVRLVQEVVGETQNWVSRLHIASYL